MFVPMFSVFSSPVALSINHRKQRKTNVTDSIRYEQRQRQIQKKKQQSTKKERGINFEKENIFG